MLYIDLIHKFTVGGTSTTFYPYNWNKWHHVGMCRRHDGTLTEEGWEFRRGNSIDECIVQYSALTRILNGELEVRLPSDHHTFLFRVDIRRGDIGVTCLTTNQLADYYKIEWSELAGMREGYYKCVEW